MSQQNPPIQHTVVYMLNMLVLSPSAGTGLISSSMPSCPMGGWGWLSVPCIYDVYSVWVGGCGCGVEGMSTVINHDTTAHVGVHM